MKVLAIIVMMMMVFLLSLGAESKRDRVLIKKVEILKLKADPSGRGSGSI